MVREDLTGKLIFESIPEGSKGVGHTGIISWKNIPGREISNSEALKLGARLAFKKQPRSLCTRSGVNEVNGNRIGDQRSHNGGSFRVL